MSGVSIFGDGGAAAAAPAPLATRPAQGLFGASERKSATPLPQPEQFGRR